MTATHQTLSHPVLTLTSDHDGLNRAFRIALGDLASSTLAYQSGLMDRPSPMIMAGLDYDEPWTRDAAINCWNAGSLLAPAIAKNTLLGVLENTPNGPIIGGQYWDKIIWVTGAWHHYLVSGDRAFLGQAAQVATNTMKELEETEFDPVLNLFRGGACFQDGVSGYPDRYVEGHQTGGPITRWAETNPQDRAPVGVGLPMMAGSTNCLYYSAYRCLSRMLSELGLSGSMECEQKAERLRQAILAKLWNPETARLAYMIDPWETCHYQEGLGISFALLFGVLEPGNVDRAITAQHLTPHGIPCVWPTFPRYETANSDGGIGRHSGTVWPHVQGFWADAVGQCHRTDLLVRELLALTANATRDAQFTEIYHPVSGAIFGGRQEVGNPVPTLSADQTPGLAIIKDWQSCRRQTWSATAYLRMVFAGLLGMRFDAQGITFAPSLGKPIQRLYLQGLPYRDATLELTINGCGQKIASITLNGKPQSEARIPATATGSQVLGIILGE